MASNVPATSPTKTASLGVSWEFIGVGLLSDLMQKVMSSTQYLRLFLPKRLQSDCKRQERLSLKSWITIKWDLEATLQTCSPEKHLLETARGTCLYHFVFILDTSSVYHWCFKCHFKPNPIKSVLWSRLKGPLKQSTNDSIIRYSATKVLVKLPATPGRSGNLQRKSTFIANPSNYQHQSFFALGIAGI